MAHGGAGPRISIVTVTNRPGSIDITWDGLRAQAVQDFEWILCDELFDRRAADVARFVDDPRLVHIPAPADPDHLWNLNKGYNEALRHCRGELVVSLQDYIWLAPQGLERFWRAYEQRGPRTFVAGVAATYALPAKVHCPGGTVTIFEAPWTGPPRRLLRVDEDRFLFPPGVSDARPWHWEINWAAAPLAALFDVGGFAEEHDATFYSCDNLTVATVADHLGYEFALDRDNVCHAIDHSSVFPRPADWEERHGRFGPWDEWYRRWRAEGRPRLGHLAPDRRQPQPAPALDLRTVGLRPSSVPGDAAARRGPRRGSQ